MTTFMDREFVFRHRAEEIYKSMLNKFIFFNIF